MEMFPTVPGGNNAVDMVRNRKTVANPNRGGSSAFLKFDFETGEFFFGRDQVEVTGERMLVHPGSLQHGWVLWVDKKARKTMVPATKDLPQEPEPVDDNYPSEARAIIGILLEQDNTQVLFETNSMGGRDGIDNLFDEIDAQVDVDPQFLYPVVELQSSSYKNRRGKSIYTPMFKVVDWTDASMSNMNVAIADNSDDDVEHEEEEPTTRRRKRRTA